jgi:hypothetical protein
MTLVGQGQGKGNAYGLILGIGYDQHREPARRPISVVPRL